MSQDQIQNSAAETARLELSIAAMASEHANRPRWLLWGAGLFVAATVVYALGGWSARSEAQRKLAAARARETTVLATVDDINRLRAAEAARGFAPDPSTSAKIEILAREIHLKLVGPVSDQEQTIGAGGVPGMTRKAYNAKIANEDPTLLLRWLGMVLEAPELRGIELGRFKLNTGPGTYAAEVEFDRWEKKP